VCRKCPLHISSVCHYIRDIRYMCGETADPRLCPQAESNPQSLDRESYRHLNQHTTIPYDHLTVSRVPPRGRLRSADTTDYLVPRTRSKFGERAFCVSGPLVWNSLPESLRTVDSITTFRRRLKTHFLTFTYHDFTFTVLVFSIIVDTCIARPVRSVVDLALNTYCKVM